MKKSELVNVIRKLVVEVKSEEKKTVYQKWQSDPAALGLGGFHTLLMKLYQKADSDNEKKLEKAYPEYFVDKK